MATTSNLVEKPNDELNMWDIAHIASNTNLNGNAFQKHILDIMQHFKTAMGYASFGQEKFTTDAMVASTESIIVEPVGASGVFITGIDLYGTDLELVTIEVKIDDVPVQPRGLTVSGAGNEAAMTCDMFRMKEKEFFWVPPAHKFQLEFNGTDTITAVLRWIQFIRAG